MAAAALAGLVRGERAVLVLPALLVRLGETQRLGIRQDFRDEPSPRACGNPQLEQQILGAEPMLGDVLLDLVDQVAGDLHLTPLLVLRVVLHQEPWTIDLSLARQVDDAAGDRQDAALVGDENIVLGIPEQPTKLLRASVLVRP
jgi:hypothetical protein